MKDILAQAVSGQHLSRARSRDAFEQIMSGLIEPPMIAAFLTALACKGETSEEICGAAQVIREHVTPIRCAADAIDTCGTGGDGISTFNVSTTAAIIAAAAGATVAKHGNRSHSRVSGSAEVLQALGVNIEADVVTLEHCLAKSGIAFLYAPALHPAMKYAGPVRQVLGIRTIFNLLGPLANPAGVQRQLIGVPRAALTETIASVLRDLGAQKAWVVHGSDGLCDLTITGPTRVTELAGGKINTFSITPAECGLDTGQLDDLRVDSPAESAQVVKAILSGEQGCRRDHALLNAGAALVVASLAGCLSEGVSKAAQSIDNGAATETLRQLADLCG